jgi:hypothetical protein
MCRPAADVVLLQQLSLMVQTKQQINPFYCNNTRFLYILYKVLEPAGTICRMAFASCSPHVTSAITAAAGARASSTFLQ